jgi:hypothetical protein
MKKSDLETGMLVQNRDGKRAIVLRGVPHYHKDVLAGDGSDNNTTTWNVLSSFNEELKSNGSDKGSDIMKVYSYPNNMHGVDFSLTDRKLLWEREEVQEMSIQDAEERLSELMGKKIKIQ